MAPAPAYTLFVGIDIAAQTFTAVWTPGGRATRRPSTYDQTADGFQTLHAALVATGSAPAQTLIVLEATSTYWMKLAVFLHQLGYQVSVLNPKQTHNYAESLPRRAKTDALDAHLLAQFAAERRPSLWTPPPAVYHELRQRLMARDALLEMRQQARNQRHALQQWPVVVASVLTQLETVIRTLDEQLSTLDAEITQVLQADAWAESAALLLSITGIGALSAAWLLVGTLNFALCATPEAATAYVGLDPLLRESGSSVRGRPQVGRGGNARLRKVLYLATLSAAQHNPIIKMFYERLRAAGKPPKVARCAAARKLLHLAWTIVTKRTPFDPSYQTRHHEERKAA